MDRCFVLFCFVIIIIFFLLFTFQQLLCNWINRIRIRNFRETGQRPGSQRTHLPKQWKAQNPVQLSLA